FVKPGRPCDPPAGNHPAGTVSIVIRGLWLRLHVTDSGLARFLLRHLRYRRDLVALVEVHHAHALGIAADDADLIDVRAVDHAASRDQHDVVAVAHRRHADHGAVALARADVADALAAAALLAIVHRRTLHRVLLAFSLYRFGRLGCFLDGLLRLRGFVT